MKTIFLAALALFVIAQVLPLGAGHTNPAVRQEPKWDKPETRVLAKRACFDCHSNESVWPWYSNVAPVSWLVGHDVTEGREHLNFSEWDRPQSKAKDAPEEVEKGEMPLGIYTPLHPEAKLTEEEKKVLIEGLRATLRADPK